MDPLAHTLFGAALAEAGLRRIARGATAALLVGANLPDVDGLAYFWGPDAGLYARRGWSHGLLAMVLLPLLLTAALLAWQRWRGRRAVGAAPDAPPARPGALLAVACLAVWSHPLLDWLNTYGVRLLMPFDGRWFYGDTLFIVDPWVWLLLAAGVVRARSGPKLAKTAWLLLALAASALIADRGLPPAVLVAWGTGLLAIGLLCRFTPRSTAPLLARSGLAAMVAYAATVFGLARHAEASAATRFPTPDHAQANPVAGVPFAFRVVLAYPDRYRLVAADGSLRELPRPPLDAVARRALDDPSIRGFATWVRFPWWEVQRQPDGMRVRLHDLRYSWPGGRNGGIGYAEVLLPAGVPAADPGGTTPPSSDRSW